MYMSTFFGLAIHGIVSTCWPCTSRGVYCDDFLESSTMEHQGSLLCSPNHVLNLFMGNVGYRNVLQLKCTTQRPSNFVHQFNSCWPKKWSHTSNNRLTWCWSNCTWHSHCFDPSKIVDCLVLHKCAKHFFLQFLRRAMMGGSQRSVRKWWLPSGNLT